MSEIIRAFIAIELNQPIKKLIKEIQSDLAKSACAIKWVKPENAHITLKFLGDVEKDKIPAFKEALEKTLKDYFKTDLLITELGAFPTIRFPRIIWLGLNDGGSLSLMAKSVEKMSQKLGIPKEKKKFSAHITIGRMKSKENAKALKAQIENFSPPESITQHIDQISFFQSTLTPEGPVYDCLFQVPLAN